MATGTQSATGTDFTMDSIYSEWKAWQKVQAAFFEYYVSSHDQNDAKIKRLASMLKEYNSTYAAQSSNAA